jgi:hypothetical protein
MNTQYPNQPKPTFVNVIAWMTLASGVVNLFWGLGLALTGLLSIIGIFCVPFMILPTVLGVFEIIYAAKLMSNPPQTVQPSTTIAILEILCILVGNLFSVVVGILALVFYNDVTVRDYFASLNGTLPPPAMPPVVPVPVAPVVDPVPSPVAAPEAPLPEEKISDRVDLVEDEPSPDVYGDTPSIDEPPLPDDETPKA